MSFAAILLLVTAAYLYGRSRALAVADGEIRRLHSLPVYHGCYLALWAVLPSLVVLLAWFAVEPWLSDAVLRSRLPASSGDLGAAELELLVANVKRLAYAQTGTSGVDLDLRSAAAAYAQCRAIGTTVAAVTAVAFGAVATGIGSRRIQPALHARNAVEAALKAIMLVASTIAIFTTVGIILSLVFETGRFFGKVPLHEFLFGLKWSPQTALRADQVGSSGAFGAVPLFVGTFLITFLAMCVAVPIGLFSAIYMSEYATPQFRGIAKPMLEILAGVPTVVYGFFAALTVAPAIRSAGEALGLSVASESALAAGLVMGVMIIPFVSSLSDDVMTAVPQALRDGSYALGATKSETIRQVVLPAALPGIVGSVLLAVSRAIGETMIVVMAAGLAANLTINPLEAVTTVTVQIVTLLVGDQEFDSAKTLAAFALGLVLFVLTLGLNVIALQFVRRYREKYD